MITSRSSASSIKSKSASGAYTAPFISLEMRKHWRIVRHEKSNREMKKAATIQEISRTKKAGTNGY